MTKKVVITGGSGKLGHYVSENLSENHYAVWSLDRIKPDYSGTAFRQVDLTDYGAVFAGIHGADIVVHLAADPRPDVDHQSAAQRFHNNMLSTYNVFNAALALGMERIIWASSETVFGYPFVINPPDYFPLDDAHACRPTSGYALAKVLGENMSTHLHNSSKIPIIGLRLSNLILPDQYRNLLPRLHADPAIRKINLWSYIDIRDAAESVRLAIESDYQGVTSMLIAAKDTIMPEPTLQLTDEYFCDMHFKHHIDTFESLLNCQLAYDLIGFKAKYSWRDSPSDSSL